MVDVVEQSTNKELLDSLGVEVPGEARRSNQGLNQLNGGGVHGEAMIEARLCGARIDEIEQRQLFQLLKASEAVRFNQPLHEPGSQERGVRQSDSPDRLSWGELRSVRRSGGGPVPVRQLR